MNEEDRFIAIETKLLHQEVILEDLHQVIYKQQELIEHLQRKLKSFEDVMNAESNTHSANEKPPHY